MSPVPAMPCTTLAKTSGAIIALMRWRNVSRMRMSQSTHVALLAAGRPLSHQPRKAPSTSPSRICWLRVNRHHAFGADEAEAGWGEAMKICFRARSRRQARRPRPRAGELRQQYYLEPEGNVPIRPSAVLRVKNYQPRELRFAFAV